MGPLRHVRGGLRHLRAYWRQWSSDRDRVYHDSLFGEQRVDPFRFSYPGNVTIRRFADLTAPFLRDAKRVLDLGCGTGEITCELARRFPDTHFEGIDHSQAGVARGRHHARVLELSNTSFREADVERFEPDQPSDLVVMFDSFHHMTDPQTFVDRMGRFCSRFLLIEPRGDWKGSWSRELDFDWLAHDLDRIRAHVAYATGESSPPASVGAEHVGQQEEPVEHRYAVEDFERLFSGYGLEIRGTVAGLESYPPAPERESPGRERFGKLAYELYAEVDDLLRDRNLDLLAKHLVIYAERGRSAARRTAPSHAPDGVAWATRVRGPYDVRYLSCDGPREAFCGQELLAQVRLRNESWRRWSSAADDAPDFLSYHWLDHRGAVSLLDGLRTALPRTVLPGEELDAALKVKAPDPRGRYMLAVDLVRESTTWYSDAGSPCLRIPIRVR